MNKKNAFTVAVQLRENMVLEMENNDISVSPVVDIFQVENI